MRTKLCKICQSAERCKNYSYCRSCQKVVHDKWVSENREHYLETKKRYLREHHKTADEKFNTHLKKNYKIDIHTYSKLMVIQNGVCAICKQEERRGDRVRLSVDHCHNTGKVRGLICDGCNNMLGKSRDSIEVLTSAIMYLTNHPMDKVVLNEDLTLFKQ